MGITHNNTLAEWVESYTQELFSWAFHKVSNAETASDLVQDTFLAAAENSGSFKGNSSPKTWLFSILNRKIIDHYRKKAHQTVNLENRPLSNFFEANGDWLANHKPHHWEEGNKNHLLDDDEFREILAQCLRALPEHWSNCMKLKYLTDKKGEEICQEVNISPSNFWQIIHRAKLQLRDCIEKNWLQN